VKRETCLICNNPDMIEILDLGYHAYADTFVTAERRCDSLPVYKLGCELCTKCGQIQTLSKTSPKERYRSHDYSYTSANSQTAKNHWIQFTDTVSKALHLEADSYIIEVGSNDGFLLEQFKSAGHTVLGIDAASYVAEIAQQRGIDTIVSIFDSGAVEAVKREHPREADVVIANNVFNHSENPLSFAHGAHALLRAGGYFVYELPYWLCSVDSQKIDQVYHEHVSYFTARSSAELMARTGFNIIKTEVVPYHGGSLRIYAQKRATHEVQHASSLQSMIQKERERFLFTTQTYDDIIEALSKKKYKFLAQVTNLKSLGEKVVAVGAAAKGNTFLNFVNLDNSMVDYVTDASLHKQGKYTPLTNIPIVSDTILKDYGKVHVIILSWNLANKLKPKLREINPQIEFLDFYE
tara:strand:- start:5767 stop:6990 length:1224 start_codon:yes stop_codon:yes gene_type:complete